MPLDLFRLIGAWIMPYKKEDDDDLFDDDFEFVDEDDEEEEDYDDEDDSAEEDSEVEEKKAPPKPKRGARAEKPAARTPAPTKSRAKPAPKPRGKAAPTELPAPEPVSEDDSAIEEPVEAEIAPEPVGLPADHVIHIYELRKFKRTIPRDFTSDDADKFAVEYNRTSANHGRWAVSGPKDAQPAAKI